MKERIVIDPPTSDARRERIERQVFEQLGAIRGAERADAVVPVARQRSYMPWLGAAIAAAAVVLVVAGMRGDPGSGSTVVPLGGVTTIVTPPGGASKFVVGDAVIDAGSDTSVEVSTIDGVALTLARGSVDCDVEPRGNRPPFRVIAGDVTVEVVGTRFMVTRTPSAVRVDVTHGKVRVRAPRGEYLVTNGQTWSSNGPITASIDPVPAAPSRTITPIEPAPSEPAIDPLVEVEPPSDPAARPAPARSVAPSAEDVYAATARLEKRDRDAAAREWRRLADGRGALAARALYALADLEANRAHAAQVLAAVDEYMRRFPRGAHAEDMLWMRADTHNSAKNHEAARAAAADYLQRFPSGTYAAPARSIITR
jgi:hypothetical protein